MSETRPNPASPDFASQQFATFWSGFGAATSAVEPVIRALAKANLELTSVISNRARAYMEIPGTLARCRTPQDLLLAQIQFWQAASAEYMNTARPMLEAWQTGFAAATTVKNGLADPRDYITFPEPKSETVSSGTRRAAERRAA